MLMSLQAAAVVALRVAEQEDDLLVGAVPSLGGSRTTIISSFDPTPGTYGSLCYGREVTVSCSNSTYISVR